MTLNLAVYLYKIKDTYPDFAWDLRSATQAKIAAVSSVMAELKDKVQKSNNAIILSIRIKETKRGAWTGRGLNSGRRHGTESSSQPGTQ